jgi:glycosyltransferase involved in cell wall biosynthesis
MNKRLKILISAYACSPFHGSEPGVGWGFVFELAKYHELWVIVEENEFRGDIERYLSKHPELSESVHFFFVLRKHNHFLRKIWPPSYYWYYRRWHAKAFDIAQELQQQIGFDIAHQLNMVGFREPGYLWQLDIPFVWGPVGGMGYFPWRFLLKIGWYGGLYYLSYNFFNFAHMHLLSRPRSAAKMAGCGLIAINKENQIGLCKFYNMPSKVCIPVGSIKTVANKINIRTNVEPIRIVWSGKLIPGKALNLTLEVMASLPLDIEWELHILGNGFLKQQYEVYAKKLGIAKSCKFYGQVTREKVLDIMSCSHVHLLTSLREGTPSVIVEAASVGLPTVCLDYSGMIDMVDDSCGIKVSMTTPKKVIEGLSQALVMLFSDEPRRQQLAKGALARAKDLSWENKGSLVNKIYEEKLAETYVISKTNDW